MSRCPHLTVVLVFLASLSLLLPSPAAASVAKDERPNFIVILAEDMGFGDLGCFNHPYARTPNIDRLLAPSL